MRHPVALFLLLGSASAFIPTSTVFSPMPTPVAATPFLDRRADATCLANTHQCAPSNEFGSSQQILCCLIGEVCGYDQGNNPACCPAGAVCTGLAPYARSSGSNTLATVLENPYFAFPMISTHFVDAAACTTAVSACSAEFSTCVAQLGGGGNGAGAAVTVDGTRVTASLRLGTMATPICSSLSALACYGMDDAESECQTTGTLQNGIVIGNGGVAERAPWRWLLMTGVVWVFLLG